MKRGGGNDVRALMHAARQNALSGLPAENSFNADWVRKLIVSGQYTRERACDTKVRFAAYSHAEKAKSDLEARHGDPGKLVIYPCPFCVGFHFASNKEFVSAATAENPAGV